MLIFIKNRPYRPFTLIWLGGNSSIHIWLEWVVLISRNNQWTYFHNGFAARQAYTCWGRLLESTSLPEIIIEHFLVCGSVYFSWWDFAPAWSIRGVPLSLRITITMTLSAGSDPDVDFHQEPAIDPSLSFDFHWATSRLSMNLCSVFIRGCLSQAPCCSDSEGALSPSVKFI